MRNILTKLFPFVFLFALVLTACGQTQAPSPDPEIPTPSASQTLEIAPEPSPDPIAQQLESMTVEQKVGQLLVAGFEGYTAGEDVQTAICDLQVGGIIFYLRNIDTAQQLTALTNRLKELNGDHIPLFLCTDQEGGTVSRMPDEIAALPSAFTFGQIEDDARRAAACTQLGTVLGELCSSFGFNMDFAPVLDVWSNPDNAIIGRRAFSTDAAVAATCADQVSAGMTAAGVIPVGKHFPGHGDTLVDSHVGLPVVDKTLEELEQLELIPFRAAIQSERPISAIMVAHILMTQLDPEHPSSLSYPVVTGLLREEMGFEGLICTDDLTMAAISDTYGMGEAAVLALEAGCDLLLVCHGSQPLWEAREGLLEAVASNRITEERLDESVYRILSLKSEYGLTNGSVSISDVDELDRQVKDLLEMLGN